jgi:hypothetical protein
MLSVINQTTFTNLKKNNMPTLNKLFTLTVTPEQFLEACSISELHEIELNIESVIKRKTEKLQGKAADTRKTMLLDANTVNFQ